MEFNPNFIKHDPKPYIQEIKESRNYSFDMYLTRVGHYHQKTRNLTLTLRADCPLLKIIGYPYFRKVEIHMAEFRRYPSILSDILGIPVQRKGANTICLNGIWFEADHITLCMPNTPSEEWKEWIRNLDIFVEDINIFAWEPNGVMPFLLGVRCYSNN